VRRDCGIAFEKGKRDPKRVDQISLKNESCHFPKNYKGEGYSTISRGLFRMSWLRKRLWGGKLWSSNRAEPSGLKKKRTLPCLRKLGRTICLKTKKKGRDVGGLEPFGC